MNELQNMQKALESGEGKYRLAYKFSDGDVQHGHPVFIHKSDAEKKKERIINEIDLVIECWVEEA